MLFRQSFLSWTKSEDAEHPLRFHFSVVAYKEMIGRHDEKSPKLAKEIYKKYLDPQRGVCQFVDLSVREQIGQQLSMPELSENLFDPSMPYIHDFLRKQHAQFVRSDAFIDFLNSLPDLNRPSTSNAPQHEECPPAAVSTPVMSRRTVTQSRKHKDPTNILTTQKLTPEILLRSQRERELILGQSSVEKMFQPPLKKYPYVCVATTSKNDSAVSSNFSSEANSHHKRNNNGFTTSTKTASRSQPQQKLNALAQRLDGSSSSFRHDTDEGRLEFANALTKRLQELVEKINRTELMNAQIQKIDRQAMFSARDVLISSEMKISSYYGVADEDEDLNTYVKQRIEDSQKPSPSQQQSPAGLPSNTIKTRRRSPKSCSPEYFPSTNQRHKFNLMSQSYVDPSVHPMRMATMQAHKYNHYQHQSNKGGFDLRHQKYYDDEDTSGIGSMATTSHFSGASSQPHFKERRERHSGSSNSKSNVTRRPKMPDFSDFSSLPRQRNTNTNSGQIRISYKESNGVPVVAYVSHKQINFREFRKYLSIPSKSQKQFFFKTKSDDNSAPYQLLLIDDDSTILPIFEGTIAAECRSLCESD
ncbi:hypothetical protein M3Y97_00417200 [Aphelenchoides bicaudatus]|nr:hypothetical protein M3Y97_00417200 [Aphelenchoides bicaudatus]